MTDPGTAEGGGRRRAARVAVAWAVVVAGLTLTPHPGAEPAVAGIPSLCLLCGGRGLADAILNVGLFLPLGWAVARWRGAATAVGVGLLLSVGIEGIQGVLPGRSSTVGDVVFNTLGAAAGAVAAGREDRALAWSAPVAALAVLAPLLLFRPAPPPGTYYGQWTARFGTMEHYGGEVVEARAGGVPLASRRTDRSAEVREALAEGAEVRVRFVAGPPPEGFAPVFSVFDHRREGLFLLGADGFDVVVRRWTVATGMRLDGPEIRWRGALEGVEPGDTVEVAFLQRSAPCLEVRGRTRCDAGPGVSEGWALLLFPGGAGAGLRRAASAGWLLVLGGAVGWGVATLAEARAVVLAVAVTAVLGGVAALGALRAPWLAPVPWLQGGLVAGGVLGAVARRARARAARGRRAGRGDEAWAGRGGDPG